MSKIFRPMLAAKAGALSLLRYPVLATPKIDGIRCLTVEPQRIMNLATSQTSIAVSRNIKPIPNSHIACQLSSLPPGLDGEIITGCTGIDNAFIPDKFNDVSSKVMSNDGFPEFQYIVFDCGHNRIWRTGEVTDYWMRVEWLKELALPPFCVKLLPVKIDDVVQLASYEQACLEMGYEGVMIRTHDSPYKFGRSTLKEQWLVKIKRFQDGEAEVIDAYELMHNDNPQTQDALGHAVRSTHSANMRPSGVLGGFTVKDLVTGKQFNVGTGYSLEQRRRFWNFRATYVGAILKYKSQPHGAHEAPRFPVFIGWRHGDDL